MLTWEHIQEALSRAYFQAIVARCGLTFGLRSTDYGVDASIQQDGETALLRLPSGNGWRLRAEGAIMTLEESIYLGGPEPRRTDQIVLTGYPDGDQQVKWAINKVG